MSRAFHTIAIPHDDILEGRLTLDVFAADLWEVHHRRGPEEYRDPELFFQKTYLTDGLRNLLEVVQRRLAGQGGDPVIQMQTPFGGGKTHALIALYHQAREWRARTVVISGTPLAGDETLWGLMAEQLAGSRAGFEGRTAPGRDALRNLLAPHQPVLILMDEVLEYMVKAAGVAVGATTLASQTLAFMQELTEAVSTLEQAALVVTLPSSTLEHYDEQATRLFEQLKKISGRVEKIFTPVQDDEVGAVIRRRLFARVDERAAGQVVNAFVEAAVQEAVIASGEESAAYRERFRQTYPFLPEVVDVLYHRWGSFPTFQRTRGTLRLLALVVHALKDRNLPYISLGHFDLSHADIRRELLKHIGNEYDSVVAADITGAEAGAVKVNREIGRSYQGLRLGERVATTIFLYSHLGGGGEAGATLNEIKRQNLSDNAPASVVAEVVQKLSSRLLFYLHEQGGRYYFSTTPNLNRALAVRMENVTPEQLAQAELEALRQQAGGQKMKTFLWPADAADIPDDEAPKLLIVRDADPQRMLEFVRTKGQAPRVHRNTLFFLAPLSTGRVPFEQLLRRRLAIADLMSQKTLSLTPEQRKQLEKDAKDAERDVRDQIGHLYRQLYLPTPDGLTALDLGIPTYGADQKLDARVYERLRTEGRLIERLAPLVIKERYLANRDFVETRQLADSGSRTPGEVLAINRQVWENSIAEGVRQGLFGLGELDEQGRLRCLYFREEPSVSLAGREVLIRAEICQDQRASQIPQMEPAIASPETPSRQSEGSSSVVREQPLSSGHASVGYRQVRLRFDLPKGKVSNLMGLLNFLQTKYGRIEITLNLEEGALNAAEMEEKVMETFRQLGIDPELL
ncbi:ATP-binding protein [Caldilinea sp.]|jgi:hypothetical protein|uniref:ATP-binding protein n=1 Tax=Caldilinea sp. TaxID=2293560 RepID=UPI0021DD670B|nr:DUF499 domain-containing protein [Caldilinea sp.]GIV69804.1 MAG: hypothetical protein KatS3mg048_2666 [Caldilinea sp.]